MADWCHRKEIKDDEVGRTLAHLTIWIFGSDRGPDETLCCKLVREEIDNASTGAFGHLLQQLSEVLPCVASSKKRCQV